MAKKVRSPKIGDRASVSEHKGVFKVTAISPMEKIVNLEQLGAPATMPRVPWDDLRYMDEEDRNQAAARIVRGATE